jgi:hypothetical protein
VERPEGYLDNHLAMLTDRRTACLYRRMSASEITGIEARETEPGRSDSAKRMLRGQMSQRFAPELDCIGRTADTGHHRVERRRLTAHQGCLWIAQNRSARFGAL